MNSPRLFDYVATGFASAGVLMVIATALCWVAQEAGERRRTQQSLIVACLVGVIIAVVATTVLYHVSWIDYHRYITGGTS